MEDPVNIEKILMTLLEVSLVGFHTQPALFCKTDQTKLS